MILKINYWEICATLDLSPVAISQNKDLVENLTNTTPRYFLEIMGHPEPIKIVTIKKCPNLLRIYGVLNCIYRLGCISKKNLKTYLFRNGFSLRTFNSFKRYIYKLF